MISKKFYSISDLEIITATLQDDGVVALPTDTIYGLHCLASNNEIIQKINILKGREANTPCITLISDINVIEKYGITLTNYEIQLVNALWPGANTVIFTKNNLSRSFRLPDNDFLIKLINITGPLVSTSANKHEQSAPNSVSEIFKIFGNEVDLYVDGGILNNPPSQIFKIENDKLLKIR